MSGLPDHISDALVAYLSEDNPALNERQARLDFAAIADAAKAREGRLIQQKRTLPTPLYSLAEDLAEVYVAHKGEVLHRAKYGGSGAEMLLLLSSGAGLEQSHSLMQAQEAIKSTQRARNKKLNTKLLPGEWQRDDARKAILKEHVVGEDDQGFPVFGGYEPAREGRPAPEVFKNAIAKLDKTSKG